MEKDEIVILDDRKLGSRKKLMLANKRFIVQKGKGILSVKWENVEEIPVREIAEAYRDPDYDGGNILPELKLKMKNGEVREFRPRLSHRREFDVSLRELSLDDYFEARVAAHQRNIDRWITAINQLIK